MIRHVVLMKFTDPADAPEAVLRLEALGPQIPEVLTLEAGVDVLHTEVSLDLCMITTHDSPEALAAYQVHPAHVAFRTWVGPRLAGRYVVDLLAGDG